MSRLSEITRKKVLRKKRSRSKIFGTSTRPRLSVFVSNLHISAQLIDDEKQTTIAQVSTIGPKAPKGNKTAKAEWVGGEIAKKAKLAKVKTIAFDRNGRRYHGRIKALADAARKEGLEF